MGFIKVASKDQIKEGDMKLVKVGKTEIVLINYSGSFYAYQAHCTHEEGPLWEGELNEKTLTCPWHGAQFDITNGKVSERTRWATDLKKFEVKVEGNDVLVNV